MTDSVRLAKPEDADSIMACLRLMHEENGLFSLSEGKVRAIINSALAPDPDVKVPPMIGVIGPVADVEATMCLTLAQPYYTDDWHLGDMWCFIRPDSRKKNHISGLLEWAKSCEEKVGIPLMTGVISNKRTAAKVRIFSKHFGEPLGAIFMWPPRLESRAR